MKKKWFNDEGYCRSLFKWLRVMKLTLFFLLAALLHVSASVYSQQTKLSISLQNVTVRDVLKLIEDQSDFFFLYKNENIDVTRTVSIDIKDKSVEYLLDQLFKGTKVSYEVVNRQIVLVDKEKANLFTQNIQQQQSVAGKVTDSSGASLPGVSVVVKGTTMGVITDTNGNYSLNSLPPDATLVFSFVGMKNQEVPVKGKTTVNIVLDEETIGIDEVVAIGYGTQKKLNLTGSISQVKADKLTDIPMPTLAQAAMGKASGVFIKNVNGQPGDDSGVEINIRGFGTPLFIVDGMPVSETYFQQLDPNDIEDFNILKDASAAAVYGARAGNGVILVKTKRGNISKPVFTYNGNYSLQFITVKPDFVSSAQYAEMENAARYNQALAPLWTEEEIQKFRDGSDPIHYPNTNWWDATLRQFAPQQQHNINVRGGTDKVKYFVSGGYYNQEAMLKSNDTKNNRYNLRSNLDIELTKKLNMGIDISVTNQDFIGPRNQMERRGSTVGIMTMLYRMRPYWRNDTSSDPNYVLTTPSEISPVVLSEMDNVGYMKWTRLSGDAKVNFSYQLPFGFKASAIFNFNRLYYRYKEKVAKTPLYYFDPDTKQYTFKQNTNNISSLSERQDITNNLIQQYFLTWDKKINDHSIGALFVYEKLSDNYDSFNASRQNYQFDIDYLFAGPDLDKNNGGSGREGGRKAYIGRFNYDYKGKYLFEVSSRYDGSVNFPSETRWGFFPSASVGWRISEEGFMKNRLTFLDNLKLRVSHGLLGYDPTNDPKNSTFFGTYPYLATYSIPSAMHIYDNSNVILKGIKSDVLPNIFITWEKMATTNAGIDFSLWDNKLEGSFDYFYRKRSDVLGTRTSSTPDVVGANLPQINYREFDNRGWEISLNHSNHVGEVKYSLGGNISMNREKTVYTDQPEYASKEIERRSNSIGEWTDRLWTLPTDGLFTSMEEIQGWADVDGKNNATILPGDIKYVDTNGDGMISNDDMILAGRGNYPRLTYGLNMSASWKGFDVSLLWQGAALYNFNLRASPDLTYPFYAGNTPTTAMYNDAYVAEGNPWMEANTDGFWPLYRTDSYNRSQRSYNTNNQFWLINGAYIRLKNVQLGYTIPKSLSAKLGIDKCKVYVSGYNLLTFSKLDFLDPEVDTNPTTTFGDYHPPVGAYNAGVIINF